MRNLSIIILMWGYGLRISETLNIKVSDLLRSELRVIGKGQKVRLIPMREELVSFIFKMLENMPFIYKDDSFVFLGEKGKKLKPEIVVLLNNILQSLFLDSSSRIKGIAA